MKIASLSLPQLRQRLHSTGVVINCGPFNVRILSNIPAIGLQLHSLYADFPLVAEEQFVDFEVRVESPSHIRRYLRSQAVLHCDDRSPFKPLPLAQAFPMLEWGLNWVISSHAHAHLIVHAAAVERNGRVLLLAADPGSGKSTLCAALVHAGWRLLSDELALIRLCDGMVQPIARPISLKNKSIDIVRSLGESIVIGEVCPNTAKGDIAHMRPPASSVAAIDLFAAPALIVFPKFDASAQFSCVREGEAHALLELTRHTFNYALLAGEGFDAIAQLLECAKVFRIQYASFDQALPEIERLWLDAL